MFKKDQLIYANATDKRPAQFGQVISNKEGDLFLARLVDGSFVRFDETGCEWVGDQKEITVRPAKPFESAYFLGATPIFVAGYVNPLQNHAISVAQEKFGVLGDGLKNLSAVTPPTTLLEAALRFFDEDEADDQIVADLIKTTIKLIQKNKESK